MLILYVTCIFISSCVTRDVFDVTYVTTYIFHVVLYTSVSHNMMHVNLDLYGVKSGFAEGPDKR